MSMCQQQQHSLYLNPLDFMAGDQFCQAACGSNSDPCGPGAAHAGAVAGPVRTSICKEGLPPLSISSWKGHWAARWLHWRPLSQLLRPQNCPRRMHGLVPWCNLHGGCLHHWGPCGPVPHSVVVPPMSDRVFLVRTPSPFSPFFHCLPQKVLMYKKGLHRWCKGVKVVLPHDLNGPRRQKAPHKNFWTFH